MNPDLLMLLHKLDPLTMYTREARWNVTEAYVSLACIGIDKLLH